MADTAPHEAVTLTETEKVEGWRLVVLLAAGYPESDAERLATRHDVDLHRAVALIDHGCAPTLAATILL